MAQAIVQYVDQLRGILQDFLSPFSTPEMSAEALAEQFLIAIEGSIVMTRIYQDPVYLERGFSYFRRFVQTIQGGRENQGAVIQGI